MNFSGVYSGQKFLPSSVHHAQALWLTLHVANTSCPHWSFNNARVPFGTNLASSIGIQTPIGNSVGSILIPICVPMTESGCAFKHH